MDNKFKFFTFGPFLRMGISGILWTLGVSLQLRFPDFWWAGLALILGGMVPLIMKNISNKPQDQGKEDWRGVSMAEVDRLQDALTQSKKLQKKFGSQGCLLFALGAVMFLGLFMFMDENPSLGTFFLDSSLFLLAGILGGRVQVFYPGELAMKMDAFSPLIKFQSPVDIILTPYIRFDQDEVGKDIPEDLRFQMEAKRKPEDFIGVQFQAAINNGPNGAVPYIYGVFLTKGQDGPGSRALGVPEIPGYVVEKGGDAQYGTLVVRQETSGGGYHTNRGDVDRLLKTCTALVKSLCVT